MQLCMPPSVSRPVASCYFTRTRQPGMPVSASDDWQEKRIDMIAAQGSVAVCLGMSDGSTLINNQEPDQSGAAGASCRRQITLKGHPLR